MAIFSPPAYVNDLPAAGQQQWSDTVNDFFTGVAKYRYFFSPLTLPAGQTGTPRLIPWNAFPKKYASVQNADPLHRFKVTEKPVTKDLGGRDYSDVFFSRNGNTYKGLKNLPFRDQDEYLEWKSYGDAASGLQKVVFSCDHPEYWRFIGSYDPALLLSLYRKYVSPAVQPADLLFSTDVYENVGTPANPDYVHRKGQYNPLNKWNTTDGIMHLTHPANYLSAEIQLAAAATVLRPNGSGGLLTDPTALCQCAGYGDPARNSDPTIGSLVNTLVRADYSVSISDPVALYIHDVSEAAFTFPGGLALKDFLTVVRGDASKGMILRMEFAAPAGSGIKLEQVKVNGLPLQYGGQIADAITMAIYGLGYKFPGIGAKQEYDCGKDVPNPAPAMALVQLIHHAGQGAKHHR